MKAFSIFTLILISIAVILLIVVLPAEAADNNLLQRLPQLRTWATDNWPAIALVLSEIAAFLPSKVNGILQGIIRVITSTLKKKK